MTAATPYRVPAEGTMAVFVAPVHARTVARVRPMVLGSYLVEVMPVADWQKTRTLQAQRVMVRQQQSGPHLGMWEVGQLETENSMLADTALGAIVLAVEFCSTVGEALGDW